MRPSVGGDDVVRDEQVGQIELIGDVAIGIRGRGRAVLPRMGIQIVDEDVNVFARQPIGTSQDDVAGGRVVGLVALDRLLRSGRQPGLQPEPQER